MAVGPERHRKERHIDSACPSATWTDWIQFADQWNARSPWHDRRVRLAANLAVDRQAINQAEYLGAARVTGSIIPHGLEFAWPAPMHPYDPAKARALLAEAGYPNGFDGGAMATDMAYTTIIEAAANYLQAVGIRVTVRGLERAGFLKENAEKKLRPLVRNGVGRPRQCLDPDRGVRRLGGDLRLRRLPGSRRALPRAGH